MGAQLAKEVASKTNDVAGDGTTTATVLAQSMVNEGMKTVSSGVNPIEVKRGMLQASEAVTDFIAGFAKTIGGKDEIAQVASISAADTEIGETIAEATTCGLCIMSGGEFYATKKEDYKASESAAALAGKCCAQGKVSDAGYCAVSDATAGKKSTAWAQPELALANCPNLKASCAGEPVIDLDKISAATETRTVGGSGVTFNQQ